MLQPFGREGKGECTWPSCTAGIAVPGARAIIRGVEVEPANVLPFPQASDAVELRHLRA